MSHAFLADSMNRSSRRNRMWYQNNLMRALQVAKENQVREIDVSIALAEQLMHKLDEPVAKPVVVPMPKLIPTEENAVMKPIEPRVMNILHKAKQKGASERYLKERNKKSPEDKFLYRVCTSWDYGWQQKQARQRARDFNFGRCFLVRHTFYRKNNIAPDPPHYAQPAGGDVHIWSEYSCINNP